MFVLDTYKVIHENGVPATAILFFVCISQNIEDRVLSLSKDSFFRQNLSNKHTMSSVQF